MSRAYQHGETDAPNNTQTLPFHLHPLKRHVGDILINHCNLTYWKTNRLAEIGPGWPLEWFPLGFKDGWSLCISWGNLLNTLLLGLEDELPLPSSVPPPHLPALPPRNRIANVIVHKLQIHLSNNNNHTIITRGRDERSARQHCSDEIHVADGKNERGELYRFRRWRRGGITKCSRLRS
jgi:hypothetical protein